MICTRVPAKPIFRAKPGSSKIAGVADARAFAAAAAMDATDLRNRDRRVVSAPGGGAAGAARCCGDTAVVGFRAMTYRTWHMKPRPTKDVANMGPSQKAQMKVPVTCSRAGALPGLR